MYMDVMFWSFAVGAYTNMYISHVISNKGKWEICEKIPVLFNHKWEFSPGVKLILL